MPDLPTFDDLFRIGRDEILTRNPRISKDAVERQGSDANIFMAGATAIGDEVVGQNGTLAASLFLDSAKGAALDRLAFDRYGLIRKPASASVGSVQFSLPVASPVTFTVPVNTGLRTTDGIQYVTTETATFLAGSAGPLVVAVRSSLAGAGQQAKIGAINSILSQIASAPAGLVVTNTLATSVSSDKEGDDSLKNRCRRFFTTVQKGTLPAIELAALGVAGVQTAKTFEVLDSIGRPARLVQLVVADSFTEQFIDTSVVPPKYQQQSQLLSTLVFDALSDTRAGGIFVQVIVANTIIQAVQLALTFTAGANVAETALAARAAVVNYINALAPGQSFVAADCRAALSLVQGLLLDRNGLVPPGTLIAPSGDISAKPLQVLRTSLALVAAVAAQNNQPIITGNNPDAFILASN